MTKYILGTISDVDTPMPPSAKGSRSLTAYLSGATEEEALKTRQQILDASPADIRALAPYVETILKSDCICVVGNAAKCREDAEMLDHLEPLVD